MDNRRIFLFIIFAISSMLLWDAWQRHNHPKGDPASAVAQVTPTPSATLQGTPSVPGAGVGTVPGVSAAPAAAETVTVRTDALVADISSEGGNLVRLELTRYRDAVDHEKPFVLIDPQYQYAAQTGFVSGQGLPNHRSIFRVLPGERELKDGQNELKLALEATADGVKVTKTFTFTRGSNLIDVSYQVDNGGDKVLKPTAYFQFQRDDKSPAGDPRMVSVFTGPAFYSSANKYEKLTFSDIEKEKDTKHVKASNDGWIAMVQHYFVSAWLPAVGTPREFFSRKVDANLVSAGVMLPMGEIAPGSKASLAVPLYAGPQEQSVIKPLAEGLEAVVDYGWLSVIAKPLFWVLEYMHMLTGNWGWAIILLTVGIKLVFFPLSAASYKSMAKMRTVTPRLVQLKERYGDDRARLNQEMMELYRNEKINPLGGCLPIVVQIPVFIALYWVLLGAVEMRQAPWLGWITDLSSADPYYILPVIMVGSMLLQTRLNPTPPDPIQAKMMMAMPFIFGVMFFFFPAGLVLYWTVNNALSIAQQWQINRMIGTKKT